MNLRWYLARLGRMSPSEIVHRLFEQVRKSMSRGQEGWERFPAPALRTVFPEWQNRVRGAGLEDQAAIRASATRILAGEFEALGVRWPRREPGDLFPSAVWTLDPVSHGNWPADAYCFDIDFRHGGGRGDVKYVWELNRLQVLPVLAAFSLQSPNPAPIRAIEAAIASWHDANRPFRGVSWASASKSPCAQSA